MNFCKFDTPFGSGCVVWDRDLIHRVFLSSLDTSAEQKVKNSFPGAARNNNSFAEETAAKLTGLASGIPCEVSREFLDFGNTSQFKKIVLNTMHDIPRGQTISYGGLARKAGFPRAARAVGNVLSSNPFPLIIPCHRVVRADGSTGSYQGGTMMKNFLLKAEND